MQVSGQVLSSINFHHDYESDSDLNLLGYRWDPQSSRNSMQVLISSNISYTGEKSLMIESSAFITPTYLVIPLNLEFDINNFFSLYFYSVDFRISVIRMQFSDRFGQNLYLDFGQSRISWERDPIFDMGVEFLEGGWFHLSRDLDADINFAVNYEDSHFPNGFVPSQIVELFIFQPFYGLHVNFIDELMFSNNPLADIAYDGHNDLIKNTNNNATAIADLVFPLDGVKFGLFIGIPIFMVIMVVLLLRRKN